MLRSRLFPGLLTFIAGVCLGGWLFSDSQPRSFLALTRCESCWRANQVAGLLASVGIQRAGAALPLVVKETGRCIAIDHPFPKYRFHLVVFPKKDIKDIADISVENQEYFLDCLGLIRALVIEHRLRRYRVETNGPGLQHVNYLHFHLVSEAEGDPPGAAAGAPEAARP